MVHGIDGVSFAVFVNAWSVLLFIELPEVIKLIWLNLENYTAWFLFTGNNVVMGTFETGLIAITTSFGFILSFQSTSCVT